MRFRMHKRTETKPDGRKIYYYSFEPIDDEPNPAPSNSDQAPPVNHPHEAQVSSSDAGMEREVKR